MINFNVFMNEIDFSELKKFFLEKGKSIEIKKKDYFVRQNEPCKFVGFVESGIFKHTRNNNDGNESVVDYSFTTDFVSDYPSFIKRSGALTSIQAVTDCSVYMISRQELNDYWETNMDTQRFGRLATEELYVEIYERLLSFYSSTPESRYIALLERCPNLPQYITLREIASFLGVTPETVSHIRRKLLQK